MKLRIAGAQIHVTRNVQTNLQSINRAIDFASEAGADILLTPEGSLSGYTHLFDVKAVKDTLLQVTNRARQAGLGLALGTCFVEADGECYNQIRFYRADGEYLGFHSKTLTCGSLEDPPQGEINVYHIAPLRTFDYGGILIGGLICNDMWANPECTPVPDSHLSQQLANKGAKIIFHAVNGGRDGSEWSRVAWQYHESNLRMRARAGHIWIVTVDSAGADVPRHSPGIPCSAPSGVVAPDGSWVCKTEPIGEQFFVYTVEF